MDIKKIFKFQNFTDRKRKRIQLIQEQTRAIEKRTEVAEKALEVMMRASQPKMTLNDELYGKGNQPYASNIWQSSSSEARRLSRIAYWESPAAQALIGRFTDLVYGQKLDLQASPVWDMLPVSYTEEQKSQIVKNIESRYRLWAKSTKSDYLEEKNHYQRSRQCFSNLLLEGEYFCLLRYPAIRRRNPLVVQIISPDNVCRIDSNILQGNTEENGIEYDGRGRAVAYHIKSGSRSVRVPKFGTRSGRQFVIHNKLGDGKRGIGLLAGIITEITKLADFQALEIQAAVVNAMFAIVVETAIGGDAKPWIPKRGIGDTNADPKEGWRLNISDYETKLQTTQQQHGGVVVQGLGEGQKATSFDTKRPTANFEAFFKATMRNLFAAKGMSYDVAMYAPEDSYSAIRTNLLIFWNRVMTLRFDHSCGYEDVIYKNWLVGEIDNGNVDMPGFMNDETTMEAWSNATWTGPARPDIDPKRSADAHALESKHGWKTDSVITSERGGGDFDENIDRKIIENRKKAEANQPIIEQEKTTYSFSEAKTESKSESKTVDGD